MVTVLIIDGDAVVRLAARRVLEHAGFAVREAADEKSPAAASADVIIVDPASLAAVRRAYGGPRILVLGAELPKRFTPSQLLAAVRLCLARPRATRVSRRRSRRPPHRRV